MVDIYAIRQVLDGVENNLKMALRETVFSSEPRKAINTERIEQALGSVQEAITLLLHVVR